MKLSNVSAASEAQSRSRGGGLSYYRDKLAQKVAFEKRRCGFSSIYFLFSSYLSALLCSPFYGSQTNVSITPGRMQTIEAVFKLL